MSGRTGASLGGGQEQSPERRKRAAAKRRREEKRWAARSGPVTTRFVDPEQLRQGGRVPPLDDDGEAPQGADVPDAS